MSVSRELDKEEVATLLESCGLCKSRLRGAGREPRLLPCLHSLCQGCVRVESPPAGGPQQQHQLQLQEGGAGLVRCPVCRQQCYLKDVTENYFLRDNVTEVGNDIIDDSNQTCTSCDDDAAATSFCMECSEWLCDACVEAHQRVKVTKDHTMMRNDVKPGAKLRDKDAVFCSIHKKELLKLFCETCDTLTCRECQLHSHKDHQYQYLDNAVENQRKALGLLVKQLGERSTSLQKSSKEVRTTIRSISEMQKRIQVEVRMAILMIMKELNKRGKSLMNDSQKFTEAHQEKLERQHWSMTKLQRHYEHVIRFGSWALSSDNNTALLLCKKMISYQLQRALQMNVEAVEPLGDVGFQWDTQFWVKTAENFGNIVFGKQNSQPLGANSHLANSGLQNQVLLMTSPGQPQKYIVGSANQDSNQGVTAQLIHPELQGASSNCKLISASAMQNSSCLSTADVKAIMRKVPTVRLERLDMDLSQEAELPIFKVTPGTETEEYNLIVVEGEGLTAPTVLGENASGSVLGAENRPNSESVLNSESLPAPTEPLDQKPCITIKQEEAAEIPISFAIPEAPVSTPSLPADVTLEVKSLCSVCQNPGELAACSQCRRHFHTRCHIPVIFEAPSAEWKCFLCQDLTVKEEPDSSEHMLELDSSIMAIDDQRKCERLILQLLCHNSSRSFHSLSGATPGESNLDLSQIRSKLLRESAPPHYSTPDQFVADVMRMFRSFNVRNEDKHVTQAIIDLRTYFEGSLKELFMDRSFPSLLGEDGAWGNSVVQGRKNPSSESLESEDVKRTRLETPLIPGN
ncbi:transcription intermediary factor 1-beta isoform X2 [Latimeria chalumnae]|uniref:Tripartite motif containing 28 n=1 Tax=Latimeria chalumnae TaxID=7897 RepID=H3AC47_LATCH|nr:PREDICTED: transcription intermediary factor 1-beta isoform X2 [Latimeria chalumnae]|eukprot:XP_014352528.1 PREDICTED: transcription intermediary factor 1-beta isoform X2 [Latimeria chalumnae]